MKYHKRGGFCMKRKYCILFLIFACACMIKSVCVKAEAVETEEVENYNLRVSVEKNYNHAKEVFEILNRERLSAGEPALTLDYELTEIAMRRSAELTLLFSHVRPNRTVVRKVGDIYISGENIAAKHKSPTHVMSAWMDSEGHRRNILNKDWTSVGIGCVKYDNMYFWVQLFSRENAKGDVTDGEVSVKETIEVSQIYLNQTPQNFPKTLSVGETAPLILGQKAMKIEDVEFYADTTSFDYISSNENVVSIDTCGNVYAKASGTAILTAYYSNTDKVACSMEVSVTPLKTGDMKEDKKNENINNENTNSEKLEEKIKLNSCKVYIEKYNFEYTGRAVKPQIRIKNGEQYLVQNKDYNLFYENNTKPGKGFAIIMGKGMYRGEIVIRFNIHTVNYKVTFCKKNGKNNVVRYVERGKNVKKIRPPKKKGYVFKGWYTKAGKKYAFSTKITKNTKLYAKWKRK